VPVDYHIHTKMCGHASGEMEQYVESARRQGLLEMGFADHIPMYFFPPEERDCSIAMGEEELPSYAERVRELQKRYHPFPVRFGIEADYTPGMEQELSNILGQYDFDYVLGSVHYLDGWGFDNSSHKGGYDKWALYELYEFYFSLLGRAAASGMFDTMAHPDLIKKFGFKPDGDIIPLYEEAVRTIAGAGVCVEINTAGFRVPAAEVYPNMEFLKLCCRYRVPVTLGSDAHKPDLVGYRFSDALSLLREAGYTEIVTFNRKNKNYIRI